MSQLTYIFIAAIAFLLIVEGFLPFIAPKVWRRMVKTLNDCSDKTLRIMGFISMALGVLLLIITHRYLL